MIIYFQADPEMVFSEIVAAQLNGVVAGTSTSVTSQVSNPCLYTATFTDLPQGMLALYGEASDGRGYYGSVVIGDETTVFADQSAASVDVKLTAERLAKIDAVEILTGPFSRTIVVLDSDTDEPIEGACVRLSRTGEAAAKRTGVDGECQFAVAVATYDYSVTASGYVGATGEIVVAGDGSTTIELTASAVAIPDDPSLASLPVLTVDQLGVPESNVFIYARMIKAPPSSTGIVFDGGTQGYISSSKGEVTITVVKGATYQLRRGASKQWMELTMTTADVQEAVSFIGVDGVS